LKIKKKDKIWKEKKFYINRYLKDRLQMELRADARESADIV